jgi:hypothetical protein
VLATAERLPKLLERARGWTAIEGPAWKAGVRPQVAWCCRSLSRVNRGLVYDVAAPFGGVKQFGPGDDG